MSRTSTLALVLAGAALVTPAAAQAHVTVQPDEAAPGDFTVINVRVPNESDDKGTRKVDVRLPDGFVFVSYQKVPGWKVSLVREKLDKAVEIEEGFTVDEQVSRVTFTSTSRSSVIAKDQYQDFPLSVRIPDGKAGSKLTFKALQTYQGGEVVRWIGAPDADAPAPQVTLTGAAASGDAHGGSGGAMNAPASTSADSSGGGSDGDGLSIAALFVGGFGLLAGVAALGRSRRSSGSSGPAQTGAGATA